MRTKKVIRYYCDHCSKGWFQKPAAIRHEAVCYRNKDRVCHRCQGEAPTLKHVWDRRQPIQAMAGECPDCLMAAVIQHNVNLDAESKAFGEGVSYPREAFFSDRNAWKKD